MEEGEKILEEITGEDYTPPSSDSSKCVKVTDSITGTNRPAGVFFTNTISLDVPEHFTSIVMAQDCTGTEPIGIDDDARVTVTSPSGRQQTVTINENDAWGKPIGEQWVLSNVIEFEPGINQIKVDITNVYIPVSYTHLRAHET